jgi:hypothetical protein
MKLFAISIINLQLLFEIIAGFEIYFIISRWKQFSIYKEL